MCPPHGQVSFGYPQKYLAYATMSCPLTDYSHPGRGRQSSYHTFYAAAPEKNFQRDFSRMFSDPSHILRNTSWMSLKSIPLFPLKSNNAMGSFSPIQSICRKKSWTSLKSSSPFPFRSS